MDDGAAVAVGAGRGAVAAAALLSSLLVALPLRCAGGARRGSRPAVGRSVGRSGAGAVPALKGGGGELRCRSGGPRPRPAAL